VTPTIRLIIAGSRTVAPTIADIDREVRALVYAEGLAVELDDYEAWGGPRAFVLEVICGKARGGDDAGDAWAAHHGIPVHPEPITEADVQRWGKYLAPKARNGRMAERATHALCFWDRASNGTTDMHARMGIRGKPSRIVAYEKRSGRSRSG
jgi:hypothetical protein